MVAVALSIAGSDPSGGAGIQADLKTFHQHRVYGCAVVTLVTAQNSLGISALQVLDADLVAAQIDAVLDDAAPLAVKTGALGNAQVVEAVAERARRMRPVVDPVMLSKSGRALLDEAGRDALVSLLLPHARLVTPNLDEAALLSGRSVADGDCVRDAARAIADLGPAAVLIKGGHLAGDPVDLLLCEGRMLELTAKRVQTPHTHGVGCTLSAAITANLAVGMKLTAAVEAAKRWLTLAIESAPGVGSGQGAVDHLREVE